MNIRFHHIVLAWLAFAFFITGIMFLFHPASAQGFNLTGEFVWDISFAIVWIVSTQLVLHLAEKFKVQKPNVIKHFAVLFSIGLFLSFVQCVVHAFLVYSLMPGSSSFTVTLILRSLFFNIDKMLIIFAVLVIMRHAISFHKKLQEKELTATRLEAQLVLSQMQALKMQLQPHFLFNTLNAIVTLIHKSPDLAEEMTVRLSDFLRMTLEVSGKQIVTLQEEMDFIRKYLEIEKIRFGERLRFQERIAGELLTAQIPALILQPLVENAIKHGISKSSSAGLLEISARQSNGLLFLSVHDDGSSTDFQVPDEEKGGIGLSNVRSRLSTLYKEKGTLDVQTSHMSGVTVTITIPFLQEDNDEN